jgi:UDP-N-acetylglucosamine--N-acetylmuramyl-(pentapeptide) pyrophosphoryl-undecaprenol N-acetylglucosamine transferase
VAEDHQTKNALALVNKDAAIMIADNEAVEKLVPEALQSIQNDELLKKLSANIEKMAKPDAAADIAKIVIETSMVK